MGKIKKVPSEGGSGGGRGHSNMEHWVHTDEIKDAARTRRRLEDRDAVREPDGVDHPLELTVLEAFRITGRGIGITFEDPTPALRVATRIRVRFHRRDGSPVCTTASVELMRRGPDDERIALLLRTDDVDDLAPGTVLAAEGAG